MAARSLFSVFALAALVLALPAATAAPIVITMTAGEVGEVDVGASGSTEVTVTLSSNAPIVCPQAGSITVSLEAQRADDSLGFGADVSPSSLSFAIAQNAYTDQTGAWESDAMTSTFTATLDATKVPQGHAAHTFAVEAVYAGGTGPGTCQSQAWEEATASVDIPVTPIFPEEPATPTGGGPTSPTGNETGNGGGGGKDSPAPGFAFVVLGALAVVALRRRK